MQGGRVVTIPSGAAFVTVGSPSVQHGDAVFQSAVTGRVELADAAEFSKAAVVGFIEGPTRTLGQRAAIRYEGIIKDVFAGFIVGARVFLKTGGVTGDTLTQTPFILEDDDHSLVPVGRAHTPTDLLIQLQPPIEF